jgi:hypothetical protein
LLLLQMTITGILQPPMGQDGGLWRRLVSSFLFDSFQQVAADAKRLPMRLPRPPENASGWKMIGLRCNRKKATDEKEKTFLGQIDFCRPISGFQASAILLGFCI